MVNEVIAQAVATGTLYPEVATVIDIGGEDSKLVVLRRDEATGKTGVADFAALAAAEPGTFFLTDYLVRHFNRLIIKGLALDRHPHLLADYFGNYRRLVYLAQTEDAALYAKAEAAAERRA